MKVAVFKPVNNVNLERYLPQEILANTELYEENIYDFQAKPLNFFEYQKSTASFKIAIIYMSNLYYGNFYYSDKLIEISDKVIFYEDECSIDTYNIIKKYNTSKFYFDVATIINEPTQATVDYSNYWFRTSSHFYLKESSYILNKLNSFSIKKYYFDILYGTPKDHRNYIQEVVQTISDRYRNKLFETPILNTSTNTMHNNTMQVHKHNIWEPEMNPTANDVYVEYYGYRKMHPSQVIPIQIYKDTAFSLVMETYYDNEFSFFTEKTVKPIIAKRLFLIAGGQYYLKNLQKLGFKTFNGIIDESYDEEPNYRKRCDMILEEMKKLIDQPQRAIYKKALPIIMHNYKHLAQFSLVNTPNYVNYVQELIYNAYLN